MELFANILLIIFNILIMVAFIFLILSIRSGFDDRFKKAQQISPIINGKTSKSRWLSNSTSLLVEAVIIKGKWQDYDVKLILDPISFRLYIFFPKLKKRGWWFIGFPQTIEKNIVWENQYLYNILKYDDFFNHEGILSQEKLIITFKELEKLAEQLLNTSQPQPRL